MVNEEKMILVGGLLGDNTNDKAFVLDLINNSWSQVKETVLMI